MSEEKMTLEEAVKLTFADGCCGLGSGCDGCYVRTRRKEGETCSAIKAEAHNVLANEFAGGNCERFRNKILPKLHFTVSLEDAPTPEPELPKRVSGYWLGGEMLARCETCEHKTDLKGGYMFCEKFHNTTVADGYCHNYEEYEDKGNEEENEGQS